MAESLNTVIRRRKDVIKNLYNALKKVDNKAEVAERFLKRIRNRKRTVPDDQDLQFIATNLKEIVKLLGDYESVLRQGW